MKLFEPRVLTRNHALGLLALALLSAIAGIAFQHPAWKFATNALWIVIMVWHIVCLGLDLMKTVQVRKRLEVLQARTHIEIDAAWKLAAQSHTCDSGDMPGTMTAQQCREQSRAHLQEAERLLGMQRAICDGMRRSLKDRIK